MTALDIDPARGMDPHALALSAELHDAITALARYMGYTFEETVELIWQATRECPQDENPGPTN